jgi:hypothetical protein
MGNNGSPSGAGAGGLRTTCPGSASSGHHVRCLSLDFALSLFP